MPNAYEIFVELAKKAGIENNQEFELAIAGSAGDSLKALEMPDSAVESFRSNLMDIDLAKKSLELKNHFTGMAFGGLEKSLFDSLREMGIDEAEITEIKTVDKSTTPKVVAALKKLNDRVEAAKKAGSKGNSEEYVKQIAEAQKAIETLKQTSESEKSALKSEFQGKMESLWKKTQLAGIQWNDAYSETVRPAVYDAALQSELSALGGKLIFDVDTNTAKLVNANDPSLPLVVSGKEFSYSDLHSRTLQAHKLIKDSSGGGPSANPTTYTPPQGGGNNPPKLPNVIQKALDAMD